MTGKSLAIGLHDFKHDCQTPVNKQCLLNIWHILDSYINIYMYMHYTNIFVLCMCFNIFNAVFCHTAPVPVLYLVLTSSLHLLMTQDSSNSTGNHPLTHTLSSSGTFRSSPPWSLNIYNKDNTVKNHYCLNSSHATL